MQRTKRDPAATREKLVTAAVRLILKQGYHATGVEAICDEAGVTKGAFFHHFEDKDALGLAVIEWWGAMGMREYSKASAEDAGDPLKQLHAMLDIMDGFASRPDEPCVCAIGMMAQELATTHPAIRERCAIELGVWTQHVAHLLRKAQLRHRPATRFDPKEVAWFLNGLWQGSMLVSKTCASPAILRQNLKLARRFIDGLFTASPQRQSHRA
jgi:TetR/AcrR family transcriptional repressor of nem operon